MDRTKPLQPPPRPLPLALGGLLFVFTLAMIPALRGFGSDMEVWKAWAVHNGQHGLRNAYGMGSGTDYLPLYQYMLWAFAKIGGSNEAIVQNIGYIRVFSLLADYWALWLLYKWIDRRVNYIFLLFCCMLNVAYAYNTLIWGQVDAQFTAFAFAAFYYLDRKRLLLSSLMIVLALNAKLQAIIFVPLWGLLMLATLYRDRRWKELLYIVPAMLGLQALILLPFALGEAGLAAVWRVVAHSVGAWSFISFNACNMWYWIVPADHTLDHDDIRGILGLTYMQIGLYAFYIASAIALWPALRHLARTLSGRTIAAFPREKIWLCAALIPMLFFFLNTEMHERYAHPAFIFITAYAFYHKRFGLYALFSLAYFLDLERVMQWLALPSYGTLVFDPAFIAGLFAIVILRLFFLLYRRNSEARMRGGSVERGRMRLIGGSLASSL